MKIIIDEKLTEIFLRKLEDYADDAFSKESAVEALRDSICETETLLACTDSGYQYKSRGTNDIYGFGESDRWMRKLTMI